MGEIVLHDFVEVAGMASMNGHRGYRVWQGELVADRNKFIVIEDLEEYPLMFFKKDIKSIKKIKEFKIVI
jgi:hypothetical protein